MGAVANVSVSFVARTAPFVKGMAAAGRSTSKFGADVAGMASKIGAIGGAISAALGGLSLTVLTKHSLEAMDSIGKMADRLGATTEELIGLKHAGDLAGVSIETIEKSFGRMQRTIDDARFGMQSATEALDDLGLTTKDFIGLSPAQQFSLVAERIRRIGSASHRTAAAMRVFGRGGAQMMNLILGGAKGLEDARKEAEALGLVFSRFDAAKVEAVNDSFTKLRSTIGTAGNAIATAIAPLTQVLLDRLTGMTAGMGGFGVAAETAFHMAAISASALVLIYNELLKKLYETGHLLKISPLTRELITAGGVRRVTAKTEAGEAYERLLKEKNPIEEYERSIMEAKNRIDAEAMKIADENARRARRRPGPIATAIAGGAARGAAGLAAAAGRRNRLLETPPEELAKMIGRAFVDEEQRRRNEALRRFMQGALDPVRPGGGRTPADVARENKDRAEMRRLAQEQLKELRRINTGSTYR